MRRPHLANSAEIAEGAVVDVLARVVKELAHGAVVAGHAAPVARRRRTVLTHGLHLEARHAHHLADGVPAQDDVSHRSARDVRDCRCHSRQKDGASEGRSGTTTRGQRACTGCRQPSICR